MTYWIYASQRGKYPLLCCVAIVSFLPVEPCAVFLRLIRVSRTASSAT